MRHEQRGWRTLGVRRYHLPVADDAPTYLWKRRRLPGFDYANPDHAYFLTVCARPGTAPFTDPALARILLESMDWLREHRGVRVYAYCLMPDHIHLLLRPGGGGQTVGDLIRSLKRFTTRQSWSLGYEGVLWQSRFYDHILRRSEDGWAIAEYIRQNPVRKGLVAEPDDYPYTGLPDPM